MVSEERIKELMVKDFPHCPLCGSGSGYNVTSAIKGNIKCNSCGAEWSSLDFNRSTRLRKLKTRELPWGAHSWVRGGHVIKRYREYPIRFWKSLEKKKRSKAGLVSRIPSELLFLALILVVAAYLRTANLDGFFGYDYDEGVYSESARMIVKGNLPHAQVFSSQPPHFILFVAAFLRFFGMNIMSARLFIVLTSLIGIVSVYLIAKSIEDFKAGLLAALALSISPYFLRQSRSVQSEVPSISFALLGIWLFFKGYKSKDDRYLLLSGVAISMGAMMKLNVGLAVPLILIFLVARKNLRGAAFFMFGSIVPLLILPLFSLDKVIDQMVLFHFAKPATGTWQNRWGSINKILMMDVGLTVTALIGVAPCILKRRLEGRFTVILTVGIFLFLLFYRSFFQHQATIIVPLLAVMSGVALAAPINMGLKIFAKTRRKELSIPVIMVILNVTLVLFYSAAAAWAINYDLRLISPKDSSSYRDAVEVIKTYADETEYIITDQQILAFFAERDVPPDLADTSHMRISSGYLDSEAVIEQAKEYNVEVIVLWTGRLKRLQDFVNYVKLNYRLVKNYGGGHEIYIRY